MHERQCHSCFEWWPADTEFFSAAPGNPPDGLSELCRACSAPPERLPGPWGAKKHSDALIDRAEELIEQGGTMKGTARRLGLHPASLKYRIQQRQKPPMIDRFLRMPRVA